MKWLSARGGARPDVRNTIKASDGSFVVAAGGDVIFGGSGAAGHFSPPSVSAPLWNLPSHVDTFAGRDRELAEISALMARDSGDVRSRVIVLHGWAGVGKSQLALAWCLRNPAQVSICWYVRSNDRVSAVADLAGLAERLCLGDSDIDKAAENAVSYLNGRADWMLIFDDARPDTVDGLVPSRGGSVVLTSRSPHWTQFGHPLEVAVLTEKDAVAYLTDNIKSSDPGSASSLARRLGHLPLALEQVRAYCNRTGCSTKEYLERYQRERLLEHGSEEARHAPIVSTVALAYREAVKEAHASGQLLELFAHLAPTRIPRELPRAAPPALPSPLRAAVADADGRGLDRSLSALLELGLAAHDSPGHLRVHQLVSEIVRDYAVDLRVTEAREVSFIRRLFQRAATDTESTYPDDWAVVALVLIAASLPPLHEDPTTWDRWATLYSHASAALALTRRTDVLTAFVQNRLGQYLEKRGESRTAQGLFEQALSTRTALLGEDHPDTLASLSNLAGALRDQGRLAESLDLNRRELDACRGKLGDRHPDTLTSFNNTAIGLHTTGELGTAQDMLEHVLAVRTEILAADDPDTVTTMLNLAGVLRDRGDPRAAAELLGRAHDIAARLPEQNALLLLGVQSSYAAILMETGDHERAEELATHAHESCLDMLGPEHSLTTTSLNNLAMVLREKGKNSEAAQHFENLLQVHTARLGAEHPTTLIALNNVATSVADLGYHADAETFFERLITSRRAVLGERHSDTVSAINNYASLLQDRGRYAEAKTLLDEALAVCTEDFGPAHPVTTTVLNNLASVMRDLGKPAAAARLFAQVMEATRKTHGDDHPHVLKAMNGLAAALSDQRMFVPAKRLLERVVKARKTKLGSRHPDTLGAEVNLATLRSETGDSRAARATLERVLSDTREIYGDRHHRTLMVRINLGGALRRSGELEAALVQFTEAAEVGRLVLSDDHPDVRAAEHNRQVVQDRLQHKRPRR